MNILEQTEALKDLPDQALVQEMQMPTGMAAPIFITSELKRRKRMRDDYARREAQDMPTVAEEVVMAAGMPQGGIADAARAMAPKSSIAQNTGMNEMMPRTATQAPQRMASGGIVRMAKGGRTQVEYDGRGYFVFADGDVQDALGRPVSDELAQAVKASLETPPERQEGTASLGSEILADASPQAPSLESVLSSDRPFSSLPPAVTDTRPAAPSDYGLGGERPSTLTDATQPAFNQEQALIDAMNPEFDTFGGEALARAEERSNLSAPSISDVSPTVDLDLTTDQRISQEDMAMAVPVPQGQPRNFTQLLSDIENPVERGKAILAQSQSDQAQPYEGGEYTNADAIRNFNERTRGKAKTPQDMAEERLLLNNMNLPPESIFSEYAGVDNPETSIIGLDRVNYADESKDFYDDISKNLLPPQASSSAERGFDPLAPLGQERAARAVLAQQAPDNAKAKEELARFLKSQEMTGGRPGGTTIEDTRMMNMLNAQRQAEEAANVEALRNTQPNVDVGTDPRFGNTMGLQEVLAGDFDPVSDASSAPATPYVPFIPTEPRVGERSIGVGDTFSRAAAAREQGLDMPDTVLPVDVRGDPSQYGFPQADSIAMGKSIQKMDDVITQQIKDIDLDIPTDMATDPDFVSRSLQEASFNMPESLPARLTPTSFSPDPEALQIDDSVVDMTAPELPPTLTDERGLLAAALDRGDPAIERGIASSLAQDVSARNVVTVPTIDDGGDKEPTTPTTPSVTGTGSSPLRDRISRMLDEREANKDADKWMALAQTGLALMASKNPTIGGALGEAGLVGVGALQKAKSSYDKDILSLLGMQEDMRTADLNYAAKVAKANAKDLPKPRTPAEVNAYLDYYQGEARRLGTVIEVDELGVEKKTYDPTKVPKSIRDEIFRLEEQYRTMFPSGATNLSD